MTKYQGSVWGELCCNFDWISRLWSKFPIRKLFAVVCALPLLEFYKPGTKTHCKKVFPCKLFWYKPVIVRFIFTYRYTGLDDCEDDCERKCGGDLQEEYDTMSSYETPPPPPMPPVQPPPLCQEGTGAPVYPKQNERPEIVHNPLLLGRLTMNIEVPILHITNTGV